MKPLGEKKWKQMGPKVCKERKKERRKEGKKERKKERKLKKT